MYQYTNFIKPYHQPYLQCKYMRVSVELIQAEASKAYLLKDSNYTFLQEMSNHPGEKKKVNFPKLDQRMKVIKQNISDLQVVDKDEWYSVIFNKIRQLISKYWNMQNLLAHKQVPPHELGDLSCIIRQSLYLLVYICATSEIQYESSIVQRMMKDFYYQEYGEEVLAYFQAANLTISEFTPREYKKQKISFQCCQNEERKEKVPFLD